ncbi:Zn-dependent protease [Bifidobacterium lemurum]|uniref:Zn-dependent protease n=1 Tax=Bifidobacterium lemurum TaxID=1603886 RepID=A0A261FNM1_9BIFI|nr:Zn-dependent protease [Bifidobacterium lemurum]
MALRMTDDEFAAAVEEALDSIPERFREVLDNVGIAMADEPNERELASMCGSHGELLGLYEGVPITQRTTSYGGVMPDIITIFKGPHERVCSTRQQLVHQIGITVIHEIGHYFGLDDDYLHSHGY